MEFLQFSAKTVNDAITKACEHFQVPSTKLEIDVVDQGSSGFLGIGAREAKIKARAKSDEEIIREEKEKEEEIKANKEREEREKKALEAAQKAMESSNNVSKVDTVKDITGNENKINKTAADNISEIEPNMEEAPTRERHDIRDGGYGRRDRRGRGEGGQRGRHSRGSHSNSRRREPNLLPIDNKNSVREFLDSMFKAMNLEVNIELKYAEEERILDVDLSGPSMGILIGKRGQTLDAIQYLTSLVVNKGEDEYIHVKVDTENYRRRRKETLENLAKNTASKVKRSRRAVSLDPMNPYERRIIHSTLQNDRFVTTYSEGNEPYRCVVVTPKGFRNGDY